MMNVKKWTAAILTASLVWNGIPITNQNVFAEEAKRSIEQEKETSVDKKIEISPLQYPEGDGKWIKLEENTYYGKIPKLRFVVTASELAIDKTTVIISSKNQREIYKVEENGKLKCNVSGKQYEFLLDLDLEQEKWKDIEDYYVTIRYSDSKEEKQVLVGSFHMLQREAELQIACEQSGEWTEKDISVQLFSQNYNNKIPVLFYVKKPNEKEFSLIPAEELKAVGEEEYSYNITESSKGKWAFCTSYDLKYIEERIFSKEQEVDIRLDKTLPRIKVEQNKTGWTNENVVFSLFNEEKNVSDISYYVKKNEEEWRLLEGNQYIVSEDEYGNQYQFKSISEIGEDSSIYSQSEEKSWISSVYTASVDKKAPSEPQITLIRKEGDMGVKEWYGKSPEIQFDYIQDEGSSVSLYYRIYSEEESEYQKYKEGETITLSKDGAYTLEYYTKDDAGNSSRVQREKLYLDTTKPEITDISFYNEKGEPLQLKDILFYPYITNKKVIVKVTASDNLTGVDKMVYQSSDGKQIAKKVMNGPEIQFSILPDFKGTIQVYCVDKVGNVSNKKESEGLIAEVVKPVVQLKFNKDIKQWQNSSIKCKAIIEDYDAGIQKITCKYAGKIIKEVDYSQKKSLIYKKEINIALVKEANTKEGNKLEILVCDNAGNVKKITKNIFIDKTKPEITATGVEQEKHYKNTATMNLMVEEAIYSYATVDIQIERKVDGRSVSYPKEKFVLSDVVSQKTLHFSEDGTYTITISATDKAKNKSKIIRQSFVVDKTAPVIEISGTNRKYYGKKVDLGIQVVESNYQEDKVKIEVIKNLKGEKSRIDIAPFPLTGKSSMLKKVLKEDGDYVVKVFAEDKAGNKAKTKTAKFTIDTTAPKIRLQGIKEKQITNKNVSLKSTIEELNYEKAGATIHIIRKNIDGDLEDVVEKELTFTNTKSEYDKVLSKEGIYTVKITAKDSVDNEVNREMTFTIDKSAPEIENLEQYDGKYLSAFSWKKGNYEFVKDLTVVENHIYLNGEEKIGDFTIEQDGKYVLEWIAKDQLNQESKKRIEFIVDSIAPEITGFMETENAERISLEETTNVYERGKIKISLSDKEDWIKSIQVNGKDIPLAATINQYEVEILEKGKYHLEIHAVDFAGNESIYQTQIKYEDRSAKILKIIIPIGIVVVFFVGGMIIWKNRKKRTEK